MRYINWGFALAACTLIAVSCSKNPSSSGGSNGGSAGEQTAGNGGESDTLGSGDADGVAGQSSPAGGSASTTSETTIGGATAAASTGCPVSNDCVAYAIDATTGRCEATRAVERTACTIPESDVTGLCDGAGACVRRTVTCGDVSCEVGPGACCQQNESVSGTMVLGASVCLAADEDTCTDPDATGPMPNRMACDGPEDCATGSVCCAVGNSFLTRMFCTDDCEPPQGAMVSFYTICESDEDCVGETGTTCQALSFDSRYRVCL